MKHPPSWRCHSTFIPESFHIESYVDAWSKLRIAHYFTNTVIYRSVAGTAAGLRRRRGLRAVQTPAGACIWCSA